jgi:uncharacterized protein
LKVRIDELRNKPLIYQGEEPVEGYPEIVSLEAAGDVRFLEPLSVSLHVEREYDHIRAEGSCDTSIGLSCSRCLADFQEPLHSEFTLFFRKGAGEPEEEEVELADHDLVSITYEGDEIDFAPCISEQVIMEIPFKPLCRQECQGLCTVCGINLNSAECGCDRRPTSISFGDLKDFTVKNKGE